jgi:hypothetical protein
VHDKLSPLRTREAAVPDSEANLVNPALCPTFCKDGIDYRQAIFFTSSRFLNVQSDQETVFFDL